RTGRPSAPVETASISSSFQGPSFCVDPLYLKSKITPMRIGPGFYRSDFFSFLSLEAVRLGWYTSPLMSKDRTYLVEGGQTGYKLFRPGDLNAFFGLMLDNLTQLVILAGILIGGFGIPKEIVLYRMIPGSAVGVLVGDLLYARMAVQLAR